jgi:hypothetical protein
MDEKGFLLGVFQKTRRVFSLKHFHSGKLLGAAQDGNREWITLIAAICMDGTFLPPSIIYQAVSGNLQNSWLTDYDPEEQTCFFASSATGWTNDELAYSWLTSIFDRNTRAKAGHGRQYRLLFIDGHGSHINMKFLTWCEQNKVLVALYPPHSTHRLQPLDVSLFSPLANYYSQNLNSWIFKAQGLSRLSKRDFFGLFWPAYQAAFTPTNIKSGWEKTGLQPFDPSRVIKQVKSDERPASSHSSSSALSDADWRKVRRLMKSIIGEVIGPEARKLNNTIEKLTTENVLLVAENQGLRRAIRIEKDRRRRGKPLFDDLGVNGEVKGVFFSPKKIQGARERQAQRNHDAQQAAAQKAEERQQKELKKLEEQRLMAERRVMREERRAEREEEAKRKKELRKQALEQRRMLRELKVKSKELKNSQKKKPEEVKAQESNDLVAIEEVEARVAQNRSTRSGRQSKAPKRFDS